MIQAFLRDLRDTAREMHERILRLERAAPGDATHLGWQLDAMERAISAIERGTVRLSDCFPRTVIVEGLHRLPPDTLRAFAERLTKPKAAGNAALVCLHGRPLSIRRWRRGLGWVVTVLPGEPTAANVGLAWEAPSRDELAGPRLYRTTGTGHSCGVLTSEYAATLDMARNWRTRERVSAALARWAAEQS